jgi:hypothetical protein
MVDLMKQNNLNCFIDTGCPRTPRDQGSVESANKLVQCVMKSISSERYLAGLEVNWTRFLGQVMAVCNSHSGRKKYCVSNNEAVFGQKYHPALMCSLAEICECRSIFQRVQISPDERLKKYIKDKDIVDIDVDKSVLASDFDEVDELEAEFDRMHPPVELDNAAFPDVAVSFDSDKEYDYKVGYHDGAGKTKAQDNDVILVGVRTASTDVPAMQPNILPPTFQEDVSSSVSLAAPKAAPPGPDRTMTSSLWTETTGGAVANDYPETFSVSEYSTFTVQEAGNNGNITQNHSILCGRQSIEYKFLFPTLTCGECCFPHLKTLISVGDGDYLNSNKLTNRWYDGVFISSFAQLAAHYAHLTVSERSRVLGDSYKQPLLLHVTYPNQILQEGEYKALPDNVKKVIAVMHDRDHYAVMVIDITVKTVVIFDQLYKDLEK